MNNNKPPATNNPTSSGSTVRVTVLDLLRKNQREQAAARVAEQQANTDDLTRSFSNLGTGR